ncbi:MAG: hypothetical protein GY798_17705 [Hyphomicrobiales bacterium]|nr:hypothetical protein [Hyphomicrobiales bacterium]
MNFFRSKVAEGTDGKRIVASLDGVSEKLSLAVPDEPVADVPAVGG